MDETHIHASTKFYSIIVEGHVMKMLVCLINRNCNSSSYAAI